MSTRNRNLFVIFYCIVLITACSNQLSIQSTSDDKVVISGPPEKFVDAYEMAKKECQKNTKNAEYITDETASLNLVAFNCVGQEVETETVAETATEAETETATESEADVETEPEAEAETKEISSE
jgi:predicted metallo-beta-lactamase superfamily hydrolase